LADRPSSYRQILRATSLIGLASGVNIIFQIIRVKVLAVLLGPGGMGLFGMYHSILTTASSLAGMGISSSAVRLIAEARSQGDEKRIGEVLYVLRVLTIGLGAIGAAAVIVFREQIALWTFGDAEYAPVIGWLAIGVFVTVASQSLSALLQAYRCIGDQARLQVWSGASSTVLAISAIVWLGKDGIIIFVVALPFVVMFIAWIYSRRLGLAATRLAWRMFFVEARSLFNLGFMIMVAGAVQGWALLGLRSYITQNLGLESAGLFQAAWALSFVYMGFVLDAMGKDYYPHLAECVADRSKAVRLMQEQLNVAVLLVAPLIVLMICFAPIILNIMYASSFQGAVETIQWMGIGNLLKVICWPLGFLVIAQGRSALFFVLEMSWFAVFLGATFILMDSFGLSSIGIAFSASYAIFLVTQYAVAMRIIGFRFSKKNITLILANGFCVFLVFSTVRYDQVIGYVVGAAVFVFITYYSYRNISIMLNVEPARIVMAKIKSKLSP
jgi:PST family polysaccharide transporter